MYTTTGDKAHTSSRRQRVVTVGYTEATGSIKDEPGVHIEVWWAGKRAHRKYPTDHPGTPHSQANWRMVIYRLDWIGKGDLHLPEQGSLILKNFHFTKLILSTRQVYKKIKFYLGQHEFIWWDIDWTNGSDILRKIIGYLRKDSGWKILSAHGRRSEFTLDKTGRASYWGELNWTLKAD